MKYKSIFILLVPFISSAALAVGSFAVQDENNDGSITRDEWYGSIGDAGVFRDWDKDKDGWIDENEFTLGNNGHEFDDWDANKDTNLDEKEFNDGWFNAYDENEDGHWDGDEWDDAGDEGLFDI